jgi:hypothetical protein
MSIAEVHRLIRCAGRLAELEATGATISALSPEWSAGDAARKPNWVLAKELFAVGSTTANRLCREAGIDPDGFGMRRATLQQEQPAEPARASRQIECARSHPHENMSAECEAKTIAARNAFVVRQVQGVALSDEVRAALEAARRFIRNGVEFGYIRMPDADCPDPAHNTLPLIERALSRASSSRAEVERWQPIETAPKDGTEVILRGRGHAHRIADGYWLKSAYNGNGAWVWPYVHLKPLYWMPLPSAPLAAAEAPNAEGKKDA